jgi:hypothetical protein
MNLIIFLTTKGHNRVSKERRYSLYKESINNLIGQCGGNLSNFFKNKILNLKIFHGDEQKAEEYTNFFKNLGFEIFIYKNEDSNINDDTIDNNRLQYMLGNYLKDLKNTCSLLSNFSEEHTFLYEDDCPIFIEKYDLEYHLNKSKIILNDYPHIGSIVCARLIFEGEYATPRLWYHQTKLKNENGIVKNHGFNFQPGVRRTKELIKTAEFLSKNWQYFEYGEPEQSFGIAFEHANHIKNLDHFAFPFEEIYSLHLGYENGKTVESHRDNRIDYNETSGYFLEKTSQLVQYNNELKKWIIK